MEHDYYSLEEAAKVAECSIGDLLKWGAAGKIKICAFYNGEAYITTDPDFSFSERRRRDRKCQEDEEIVETTDQKLAFRSWLEREPLLDEEARLCFNELLPIRPDDIFRFYLKFIKDQSACMSASFEFPVIRKEGEARFLYPFDFEAGRQPSAQIDTASLFITKEELFRVGGKIGHAPEYLNPNHPCHSWALHIAVRAWQHFYEGADSKSGAGEEKVKRWISSNYPWAASVNNLDRIVRVVRAVELDKKAP